MPEDIKQTFNPSTSNQTNKSVHSTLLSILSQFPYDGNVDLAYALYSYLQQRQMDEGVEQATQDQESHQECLLKFVFLCLAMGHWRQNEEVFFQQIKSVLQFLQEKIPLEQDFVQRLCRLQICQVASQQDIYEIVKRQHVDSGSRQLCRILPDGLQKVVCLTLSANNVLSVKSYLPYGVIYKGQILPLSDGTDIEYSADLQLMSHRLHLLRKGENGFYFIKKLDQDFCVTSLLGVRLASKSFDQVLTFEQMPGVFFGLKRLEQFFIDRSTDTYYKELIHSLEFQIQKLSENAHKGCLEESVCVYEKVRAVFEEVFQGDKLISLLLKQLGWHIDQVRSHLQMNIDHRNVKKTSSSLGPEWGL